MIAWKGVSEEKKLSMQTQSSGIRMSKTTYLQERPYMTCVKSLSAIRPGCEDVRRPSHP